MLPTSTQYSESQHPTEPGKPELWVRDDCAASLKEIGFDRFSTIWDSPGELVEPPNQRRGGWSGVTRFTAGDCDLFVKRQQNQPRRSWSIPLSAPTYRFEFEICRKLGDVALCHGPMLYGERDGDKGRQAILISESLVGQFVPLDKFLGSGEPDNINTALRELSRQLADLHRMRVQFGALILSHIWIAPETGEARLIDWERARFRRSANAAAIHDFERLLRRSFSITEANREALLCAYQDDLSAVHDTIIRNTETA